MIEAWTRWLIGGLTALALMEFTDWSVWVIVGILLLGALITGFVTAFVEDITK